MNSENTVSVKVLVDKQVYEKLKSDFHHLVLTMFVWRAVCNTIISSTQNHLSNFCIKLTKILFPKPKSCYILVR